MEANFPSSNSFSLAAEDLNSLQLLGKYQTGYLDIDSQGHITSNYERTSTGAVWRKGRWMAGFALDSKDILNLNHLFYRVHLSQNHGEDHSELVKSAIGGLEKLAQFYNITFPNKEETNALIQNVKSTAEKFLQVKHQNTNQLQAYTPKIEMSMIGSSGLSYLDGLSYYSIKINCFTQIKEDCYSKKQIELLNSMKKALDFGFYFHTKYSGYSIYDTEEFAGMNYPSANPLVVQKQAKELIEFLNSLSQEDQILVGVLIPCGYKGLTVNDNGIEIPSAPKGGHSSPVGFRLDPSGKGMIMSQYNVGGGCLGDCYNQFDFNNLFFHISNLGLPSAVFGQPVVSFGPYNSEMLPKKIEQVLKQGNSELTDTVNGLDKAVKSFQSIFDQDRKIENKVPDRRFQVVGNCVTRNVLEWMVDVCQRAGEVELINDFMQFGQSRSVLESPDIEFAKPLNNTNTL